MIIIINNDQKHQTVSLPSKMLGQGGSMRDPPGPGQRARTKRARPDLLRGFVQGPARTGWSEAPGSARALLVQDKAFSVGCLWRGGAGRSKTKAAAASSPPMDAPYLPRPPCSEEKGRRLFFF